MNLEVEELEFYYEAKKILSEINFTADEGEFIGVIGPNGSGKTTLLKLIDRLLNPTGGEIRVDGKEIRELEEREIAKLLAIVPQESYIEFDLTVSEFVMMGRYPYLGRLGEEKREDFRVSAEALRLTDSIGLAEKSMRKLSGGEKQRIVIARALAQRPRILLLDEPTANLDINYQLEIMSLLKKLTREKKLIVLCAIHDLNLASRYCDRLILLNNGRIKAIGKPHEVLTRENLREAFRVEAETQYNPKTKSIQVIPIKSLSNRPKENTKQSLTYRIKTSNQTKE